MLIGNLGRDPEVRHFEDGGMLAKFPLATSETYTSRQSGQRTTTTEWHNIVVRRGLAEVCEKYLKKGDKIFVEGRIRTRQWDDESGNKRYATEIQCDNMTMLGARREEENMMNSGTAPMGGTTSNTPAQEQDPEDDLPF